MMNTILFDLDGTLLDTLGDITDSANLTLQSYGFEPRTSAEIKDCIGDGLIKLIQRIMPRNSDKAVIDEALLLYRSFYAKNKFNKTRPYDGIIDMLWRAKQAGMKIAVVTNKKETSAIELTERYFGGFIDITVGDNSVRPLKPDAASINHALALLNSSDSESIFIGDSEIDIKAAQNAKLHSVGVTWGYRNIQILKAHKADYLVNTPKELTDYILSSSERSTRNNCEY